MGFITGLRIWAWVWLNWGEPDESACPVCGRILYAQGFKGHNRRYECRDKDCDFNRLNMGGMR